MNKRMFAVFTTILALGLQFNVSISQELPWDEKEILNSMYNQMINPPSTTNRTWSKITSIKTNKLKGHVLAWGKFQLYSKPFDNAMVVLEYNVESGDRWALAAASRNLLSGSEWRFDELHGFDMEALAIDEYDHPLSLEEVLSFTELWFPPKLQLPESELLSGGVVASVWDKYIGQNPLSVEKLVER